MEPFCTITPTRGDRPELLEHCKYQLSRMTTKPDKSYFVGYAPVSDAPDLVDRIRVGIAQAEADGFDIVAIYEDDDMYGPNYFKSPIFTLRQYPNLKFIGDTTTHYYHLKSLGMYMTNHPRRSSLFKTFFRISALKNFDWSSVQGVWLDIALWKFAYQEHGKRAVSLQDLDAVGIKHGCGLTGGKGHTMPYPVHDIPEMHWLSRQVRDEKEMCFYREMHKKLNA